MFEIEFIRKKHFKQGWSIRRISRDLGISRNTVRKALKTTEIPKYNLQAKRPAPKMDKVAEIVIKWLKDDENAPKKQRHTAKRIYDRLVEEYGFSGAESTVRRFVAKHKKQKRQVFIPLDCNYGEVAQADWGEARVIINGIEIVVHLFCLRLRKSRAPFAMAFPTEKLEAFLAGHVQAFEFFNGIPATIIYDNPKTAVTKILAGPKRKLHLSFSSLRSYYLFDSQFCNPGAGHEKGSVENLVGFIRRNALVPVPSFASFTELNKHLLKWCRRQALANEKEFLKDKAALRALPIFAFKPRTIHFLVVDKLSLIRFDRNRYSVPSNMAAMTLRIEAYWNHLEVFLKDRLICRLKRSYKRGETIVDIFHYLAVLKKKPRAVCHAQAVRQLPKIFQEARVRLTSAHPQGYKEFLKILLLAKEFEFCKIETALREAMSLPYGLRAPVVRQIILNKKQTPLKTAKLPKSLKTYSFSLPNPGIYDHLGAL